MVVDLAVEVHRGGHVAGIDVLRGLPRLPQRDEDLLGVLVGHGLPGRDAALPHHPLDKIAEGGKRLTRRVLELRLKRRPLGLPVVSVETRLAHPTFSLPLGQGISNTRPAPYTRPA